MAEIVIDNTVSLHGANCRARVRVTYETVVKVLGQPKKYGLSASTRLWTGTIDGRPFSVFDYDRNYLYRRGDFDIEQGVRVWHINTFDQATTDKVKSMIKEAKK